MFCLRINDACYQCVIASLQVSTAAVVYFCVKELTILCTCVVECCCCSIWSNVCKLLNMLQMSIATKDTAAELQKCTLTILKTFCSYFTSTDDCDTGFGDVVII